MIDRGWVLILLTPFSIYAKLVTYLPSSNFLQPMKNNILSIAEYFNTLGVTTKSVGSYKGPEKVIHLGDFPCLYHPPSIFQKPP